MKIDNTIIAAIIAGIFAIVAATIPLISRKRKKDDLTLSDPASSIFVKKICSVDMNSLKSKKTTRDFINRGPNVIPDVFAFLKHKDARVRYWCAWSLVACIKRHHLKEWLAVNDVHGSHRRTLREALVGLPNLAALEHYEDLIKYLDIESGK